LWAFFELALFAGMRPSEILALKWESVDLEGRTEEGPLVRVVRSLVWDHGRWSLHKPKTDSGTRSITIPDSTVKALERQRERQRELWERAGESWAAHDFVFTNEIGEPLKVGKVRSSHFRPMLRRTAEVLFPAEPPDPEVSRRRREFLKTRLYDLRHTAASLMLAVGANPKVVSTRMGHANVGFTLTVYAHLMPGDQRRVTERLAEEMMES
jgi:integrase